MIMTVGLNNCICVDPPDIVFYQIFLLWKLHVSELHVNEAVWWCGADSLVSCPLSLQWWGVSEACRCPRVATEFNKAVKWKRVTDLQMLLRAAFGHYCTLIHSPSNCVVNFINNFLPRRVYAKTEKLTQQMKLENAGVEARICCA